MGFTALKSRSDFEPKILPMTDANDILTVLFVFYIPSTHARARNRTKLAHLQQLCKCALPYRKNRTCRPGLPSPSLPSPGFIPRLAIPRLAIPRLAIPRLAIPRLAIPRLAIPRGRPEIIFRAAARKTNFCSALHDAPARQAASYLVVQNHLRSSSAIGATAGHIRSAGARLRPPPADPIGHRRVSRAHCLSCCF